MIQYFDEQDRLIHEGAGVIVQNEEGDILFFLRTKYPFLWTIPGGHMSPGEDSKAAALRELEEEVGLSIQTAQLIFEGIIEGDECMGGATIHKWYLYHAKVKDVAVHLDDEGSRFAWFPISSIPENITYPVAYLLEQPGVKHAIGSMV
jgi:8-oxo-dGTP diphosphatase